MCSLDFQCGETRKIDKGDSFPGEEKKELSGITIQLFGIVREFGQCALQARRRKESRTTSFEKGLTSRLLGFVATRQNLTEIPPRTDRLLLPTTIVDSEFSELTAVSNRFRASKTASARTGNPKLGNS